MANSRKSGKKHVSPRGELEAPDRLFPSDLIDEQAETLRAAEKNNADRTRMLTALVSINPLVAGQSVGQHNNKERRLVAHLIGELPKRIIFPEHFTKSPEFPCDRIEALIDRIAEIQTAYRFAFNLTPDDNLEEELEELRLRPPRSPKSEPEGEKKKARRRWYQATEWLFHNDLSKLRDVMIKMTESEAGRVTLWEIAAIALNRVAWDVAQVISMDMPAPSVDLSPDEEGLHAEARPDAAVDASVCPYHLDGQNLAAISAPTKTITLSEPEEKTMILLIECFTKNDGITSHEAKKRDVDRISTHVGTIKAKLVTESMPDHFDTPGPQGRGRNTNLRKYRIKQA